MPRTIGLLLTTLLLVPACSRKETPASPHLSDERGVVSLERVVARSEPSAVAPAPATLVRGTSVRIVEARGGYLRVVPAGGGEAWIPEEGVERLTAKAAREKRAEAVAGFAAQPGRAVETCPILLAPDYGAARWGSLEDGDDVDVVLADHDFYGVRLAGKNLAFVPARSIRLLPSPVGRTETAESRGRPRAPVPAITPLAPAGPRAQAASPIPPAAPPPPPARSEPLVSLPAGAEPPLLVTRVDARYPEMARRLRLSGEVVLRIVVEANGSVGKIDVVNPAPGGMTDAAIEAVRSWVYHPALVEGRPVAVYKTVRVRFNLTPVREAPPD